MLRSSAPENDTITVGELADEFLSDCRIRNLSRDTLDWYQSRLRTLLRDHWNRDLAGLRLDEVKAVIAALMDDRSPSTVNGYVRCLKSLLNYAIDNDYTICINPRRLRKAKEPKRIPPCFTPEQVASRTMVFPRSDSTAKSSPRVISIFFCSPFVTPRSAA